MRLFIRKAAPFKPSGNTPKAGTPKVPQSKEDQLKASKAPAAPRATPSASGVQGEKRSKYGQEVDHFDKKRYPNRPNNALDETASTWVLPKGQSPQYNKDPKKKDEDGEEKVTIGPEDLQPTIPQAKNSDHGEVKAAPPTSEAPDATKPSLLTGNSKPPQAKTPEQKEQQKQDMDTGQWAIAELRAGRKVEHKDGTKIYSKRGEGGEILAHVKVGPDGKKEIFHSDAELVEHFTKQKAQQSASDAKKLANAAKNSGEDDLADKYAKEAEARERIDIDAVSSELGEKKKKEIQEAQARGEPVDMDALYEQLSSKKEKDAKLSAKKEAKDEALADKEAAKFKDKLEARAKKDKDLKSKKADDDMKAADKEAAKFREKLYIRNKKNKEKEQKKLEAKKNSSDEKVVKEAQKELKARHEERQRKAKQPDSPEAQAAHHMHTSKAKEASKKVEELQLDPEFGSEQKLLAEIKQALKEHANQKHEPNGEEKKKLNELVKLVNNKHGNKAKGEKALARESDKQAKLKIKEESRANKEADKKAKDEAKAQEKASKEKQRAEEKAAKDAAKQNPDQMVTANDRPDRAADKIGLGAFHSGRAAGSAAASAAASESGSGLGAQAFGGVASGAVNAGHSLLSGKDKDEDRRTYTVSNKPREVSQASMDSAMAKSYSVPLDYETASILKSITATVHSTLCPVSDTEFEFLVEQGFAREDIFKGNVRLKGNLQSQYSDWLCNRTMSAIKRLYE